MITVTRKHNPEMRWTELWASCSCGWKNSAPIRMWTDMAMQSAGTFDFDADEAEQLQRVRDFHRCNGGG